jgi:photosynthetic reaction center cytochrome c subunit
MAFDILSLLVAVHPSQPQVGSAVRCGNACSVSYAGRRVSRSSFWSIGTLLLAAANVSACSSDAGIETVQTGYRGTAMAQVYSREATMSRYRTIASAIPQTAPPADAMPAGPLPWQNVQVLNDVSVVELLRTMEAMATWVGGNPANCAFCHWVDQPWSDTTSDGKPLYRKLTARRMLQMVRNINGRHDGHVKNTGVTCYTCHLGKALPSGLWFYESPNDYLRHYLDRDGARVVTQAVSPGMGNRSSIKQAEWTYALMISQSRSLGVNCTYCHNSRQFASWREAPPQRVVAYAGITMLRDINTNFLAPLNSVLPDHRLGAMGDAPKAQCVTCHNGNYKPLYGRQLAIEYPALWGRAVWGDRPFPTALPMPVEQ